MDLKIIAETISKGDVVLVTFLFLSIIQITPIKINPWTWLGKCIGKAINGEIAKEVKCMRNDLVGVHKELDDLKKREELKDADATRNRILRFDDELRQHVKHSKEYFDQMLEDIDGYLEFCREHEKYQNSKADSAIKHILKCYDKVKEENDFI